MTSWKHYYTLRKGVSHIASNTPCQDAVNIIENKEYIIAVLADGLGSLNYSEVASRAVTKGIAEAFATLPSKSFVNAANQKFGGEIIRKARNLIQQAAYEHGLSETDMDCTLLFVCIYKRMNYAIIGQIGDGAICVFYKDSAELFSSQDKQVAGGTATVMSCDEGSLRLKLIDLKSESVSGFILSSDGLENELYFHFGYVKQVAADYLNALHSKSEQPEEIVNGLIDRIVTSTSSVYDDDISVAIISCLDGDINLPNDVNWLCQCGQRVGLQNTRCPECGCDILDLHDPISYQEHGGKLQTLLWLNEHPSEEQKLVEQYIRSHRKNGTVLPEQNEDPHQGNCAFEGGLIEQYTHSQKVPPPKKVFPTQGVPQKSSNPHKSVVDNSNNHSRHGQSNIKTLLKKRIAFPLVALLLCCFYVAGFASASCINSCIKNPAPTATGNDTTAPGFIDHSLISAPCSSEECLGMEYSEIRAKFMDAGFTNIVPAPINDLGYGDDNKQNSVASVKIDGATDFGRGTKFANNSEVQIAYHDFKQCAINVAVNFHENLLFDRYDVDFFINDNIIGTLRHGESKNFNLNLQPGDYVFMFRNPQSSAQDGSVCVKITDNATILLRITCEYHGVTIKAKTQD